MPALTTADVIARVIARETGGVPFEQSRARLTAGDRGGWTRAGMTAANVGAFLGLGRAATASELDALTGDQALAFYTAYGGPYWTVHEPLRSLLMDWSVTSGNAAAKGLQVALVRQGAYRRPDGSVAAVDGIIGPVTVTALTNVGDQRQLYRDCVAGMFQHYMAAVVRDPRIPVDVKQNTNIKFGSGWINRAVQFIP